MKIVYQYLYMKNIHCLARLTIQLVKISCMFKNVYNKYWIMFKHELKVDHENKILKVIF